MDPMKKVIASFMMDVNDYLSFVADYGKPNHKYFNFVLNRMGLLYVYISKDDIFRTHALAGQFIELSLVALKKQFLTEQSPLKRAAVIFMISKIFFTDEMVNLFKLRITFDEWKTIKDYLEEIKEKPEYLTIRIMIYQLLTENFFKFTIRNKSLALDYGTVDNEVESRLYSNRDAIFWNEIKQELRILEHSKVNLQQLYALREEAIKPFEIIFPETDVLKDALNEFEALKLFIQAPSEPMEPRKVSKKRASEACKDFLKTSGVAGPYQVIEPEEIEWNSELELDEQPTTTSRKPVTRRKRKNPPQPTQQPADDHSSSESEKDFRRMNRSLGYASQNIMQGIGANNNVSDKLKECYGK